MNRSRRKQLEEIKEKIAGIVEQLQTLGDEEQDAYENLPESLQNSERGEQMQNNSEDLYNIASDIETAQTSLAELLGE